MSFLRDVADSSRGGGRAHHGALRMRVNTFKIKDDVLSLFQLQFAAMFSGDLAEFDILSRLALVRYICTNQLRHQTAYFIQN